MSLVLCNKRGRDGGGGSRDKKAQLLSSLKEDVEMMTLRATAKNLNNPTIAECLTNMNAMFQVAEAKDKNSIKQALDALSAEDLEKLLGVTSVSTRALDRSKAIAETLFKNSFVTLGEIGKQCEMAKAAVPQSVYYMMLGVFGDESGTVNWADFTALVSKTMAEKAIAAANAGAGRGLGM